MPWECMKQFESYRNSVARLSTKLTMAAYTWVANETRRLYYAAEGGVGCGDGCGDGCWR
jgi:hypothetical protein